MSVEAGDLEFMELDNLTAFTDTDLRRDPALVKLFKECGCGHLLTEDLSESGGDFRGGYAAGLRKYLGDLDGLTRRLEQAARTAHLRGGLEGQPAGLENLSGLLAGLHDK